MKAERLSFIEHDNAGKPHAAVMLAETPELLLARKPRLLAGVGLHLTAA